MNPIKHPSNTRTLGAPAGWDQSGLPVEPLGITDTELEGVPCVMSFWQPDDVDLANIAAGGLIGLSIVGRTMPPACVVTLYPEGHASTPHVFSNQASTAEQTLVATALHSTTADLVVRFSRALAEKLTAAENKYGYTDGWLSPDWMDECRAKLLEHVAKGDPRDVAAYCAFLWHHGASTSQQHAEVAEPDSGIELAARFVEKRLMDYDAAHGMTDPETGTREYPGDGAEYVGELQEIAEGIRAIAAQPPAARGTDQP